MATPYETLSDIADEYFAAQDREHRAMALLVLLSDTPDSTAKTDALAELSAANAATDSKRQALLDSLRQAATHWETRGERRE